MSGVTVKVRFCAPPNFGLLEGIGGLILISSSVSSYGKRRQLKRTRNMHRNIFYATGLPLCLSGVTFNKVKTFCVFLCPCFKSYIEDVVNSVTKGYTIHKSK